MHGGPADVIGDADGALPPFWKPDALQTLRLVGWRWALLAPLLLAIGWTLALPFVTSWASVGTSLWFLSFVLPPTIAILIWAFRNAVRLRRDLFCIHCGYSLTDMAQRGTCPECGRAYAAGAIREYQKDPFFFVHRWKSVRRLAKAPPFPAGGGPTPDDGTR